ncbi:MAG: hypothetical protein JWO31_2651 [Phycisphaerales bacterium]|nr:hypothetical protein [Phycisphaerales bacterium]
MFISTAIAAAAGSLPAAAEPPGPATSAQPASGPATARAARASVPLAYAMAVRPAAPARPALRYRLLPPPADLTPGNAAPLYLTAAGLYPQADDAFVNKVLTDDEVRRFGLPDNKAENHTWSSLFLEVPLAALATDPPELKQYLADTESAYRLLDIASRRETCAWDLPLREQGFDALLPHLNGMRRLATAACVRARRAMAAGDVDAAVRALRVDFAMAKALDQQAVLVQELVGVGIAALGLARVRELAGLPDAPNLYWPLADLPAPLLDVRRALETERALLAHTFPEMKKVRDGTFGEADWAALTERVGKLTRTVRSFWENRPTIPPPGALAERLGAVAASAYLLPQARQYLASRGLTPAELDALPPAVVLGRFVFGSYDEAYDEVVKWTAVPYAAARGRAAEARAVQRRLAAGASANPLFSIIPSVERAVITSNQLARQVAAQQTVEALRAHAAGHGGILPASLDALADSDTPVPPDPFTGRPFVYRPGDGGRSAVLESLVPERPTDGLVVTVNVR